MSRATMQESSVDIAAPTLELKMRKLHPTISSMRDLNSALSLIAQMQTGLIVFSGATGTGKTTSQADLIKEINRTRESEIITVEDPREIAYAAGKSTITHYEIGEDVDSFSSGVRRAIRKDPDVLQIAELRDHETIGIAIEQAAHRLIIASLHATSAEDVMGRMIDAFHSSEEKAARVALSKLIVLSVHQEWQRSNTGRVLNIEVLGLASRC